MTKRANENQKEAVLELFFTQHDNSIQSISSMTNLTFRQVSNIIDNELASKERKTMNKISKTN
jgi:two-component sensor histidine kinase